MTQYNTQNRLLNGTKSYFIFPRRSSFSLIFIQSNNIDHYKYNIRIKESRQKI